MKAKELSFSIAVALLLTFAPPPNKAQEFDIFTFDETAQGPWSAHGTTTLMVPKVANGSITLDGEFTPAEYGGFQGVTVTPGVNAWILGWPEDRTWTDAADSSFTFWLAHDDNYLYIATAAQDDVVTSDDPNAAFWRDDAIEIVIDALNDGFDNNTDTSKDQFGGHVYFNYLGRFSRWDDQANTRQGDTWANGVEFTYSATGDVFGSGKSVAGGWQMETRLHKRQFEDPAAGNKLRNGYRMGFNIGLDDDDKQGTGPAGNSARSQDLEIQYFWANRQRYQGYNADYLATLTPEELAGQVWRFDVDNHPLIIDATGRLAHGGAGDILFGYDADKRSSGKVLFVVSQVPPINADPALIALLQAKGYEVTVFPSGGSTPEGLREAAAGQDVVLISETIGSTSVVDPAGAATGIFSLQDTDIPVISFEAFMFDNAHWVNHDEGFNNDWDNWGNTGRSEVPAEVQDARDSLYVRKADHPIVAGLTGKVKVYNSPYSLNWGKPTADADIVASVQEDGSYPTIFVYETGDRLVDGSAVPNKRIGFFLGQTANPAANWPTDIGDLNETGKTILFNTLDYAIGRKAAPTLSYSRNGSNLVLTYAGGILQSANAVTGAWNNETGASPLSVPMTAPAKFYRVQGN